LNDEYVIEMPASSDNPPGPGEDPSDGAGAPSVDTAEIAGFEALAAQWWDPDGPFRPLHRFNPARVGFIRDHAAAHHGRSPQTDRPLDGLALLDIGTGGGLVAEPMVRLGAQVTGIDPSAKNIGIAGAHAAAMGLEITYRAASAERLAEEGAGFDIVLALEVVEHVADLGAFMGAASQLVRPGGICITATLNRTARAYALAIIGAEYVMAWLPRGTHDWNKFVTPAELTAAMKASGLRAKTVSGIVFSPLTASWRIGTDTGVNYIVAAEKAP
jgi:2-polyprenyl-6-hydroxyphenyl methylase/3-demethylubiquinone-9 3-methyltransferase